MRPHAIIFEDMPGRVRRVPLPPALVSYWRASRAPRYSVLFALPLLLLYEALVTFIPAGSGPELRNGADVVLREAFQTLAGPRYAPLVFGVTVVSLSIWFIARDLRSTRTPLDWRVLVGMAFESVMLALCFGSVVGTVTARLLNVAGRSAGAIPAAIVMGAQSGAVATALPSPAAASPLAGVPTVTKVMLSLGAGLYEELLFRVILVTAIAFLARRLLGWRPLTSSLTAIVLSALIFAAFHYIGPYGDQLRLDSFVFRLIGGLAFSALYVTRGFGITARTHALYDLFVLVA